MGELLRGPQPDEELAAQLTGLEPGHPLFGGVVEVVSEARAPARDRDAVTTTCGRPRTTVRGRPPVVPGTPDAPG